MKDLFTKIILIVFSFCFIDVVYAIDNDIDSEVCSSTDKVELITLASYIDIDFEYDDETELFDIVFENGSPYISYEYDGDIYKHSSKGTRLKGFKEGTSISINMVASEYSNCYKENIKNILYTVPYVNRFLDTQECKNNPRTEICNTKFLNYKLTNSVFQKMIKEVEEKTQEKETKEEEDKIAWYEPYLVYVDKYGMQVFLFLIGFFSVFVLGHNAVKRAKAKF